MAASQTIISVLALVFGAPPLAASEPQQLELIETKRIWDESPHCAFTDLVHWHDTWYCGFREGMGHAGDRGHLRIIRSIDGKSWDSVATIGHDEFDFRDAALSITPDDRMMVIAGSQHSVNGEPSTGTFVSFSDDGTTFTKPERVFDQGRWLWRVTWHKGTGYGVTYATPADYPVARLVTTRDGRRYETLVPEFLSEGWPTEARIRFDSGDTAYCLQRVDRGRVTSLLGTSQPPYQDWTWSDLGQRVGGPNFIQLPSGQWVGCGRLTTNGKSHTEVFDLDVAKGKLTPLVRLPSAGDSSYPGMVWHDNQLWVSYYSSHEGKTSIYLSRLAPIESE